MEWLNYHHFYYFWVVARSGSITQACKELNLTPQTVSAQLQDLEEHLGENLFLRQNRRLVLTEVGQLAYQYANEIFVLGREFLDVVGKRPTGRPMKLRVGITDVLPKFVVHHLLDPAFHIEEMVHLVCIEDSTEKLLASLAVHELDVVLSDTPVPPTVSIKAFSHLLGECGVSFLAATKDAAKYKKRFPTNLDGAPFLLPTDDTALRRSLEHWFSDNGIRPRIVGEFADSSLMKVFGQFGTGIFAIPDVIEAEIRRQYRVSHIGKADGIIERFYAISVEKKIKHPAVAAICSAAQNELFA